MPSAKEIKKKIRSIANTRKITRTMEMVASVKAKRTLDALRASAAYSARLSDLLRMLGRAPGVEHPLLPPPKVPVVPPLAERVLSAAGRAGAAVWDRAMPVLAEATGIGEAAAPEAAPAGAPARPGGRAPALLAIVAGNRGLCGGYNTNVLALAERFLEAERAAGRETVVAAVGRKAIARLRFRKIPVALAVTSIGDAPSFEDARALCRTFREKFESGEVSRVVVIATRYFSSGLQRPVEIPLLPFSLERPPVLPVFVPAAAEPSGAEPKGEAGAAGGEGLEVIFEPGRRDLVEALVPLAVDYALFKILLEARASEHIARRVAMKTATDNAETMIRTYTTSYNRQRQAGITRQIVEVVSGADALG